MSEFRGKVLRALSWTAGGKVLSQAVSMGFGIALARMLTPDDFGLIAMMIVFTGFAALLADVGLGSALVQKTDVQEIHYSTVFWTNLGLGVFLTGFVALCSPIIAEFYGRSELVGIGYVLSLQFVIGALALVPRQRLVKSLTFRFTATADLLGMLVAGISAVVMVKLGYGVWALAWQVIILRIVSTAYIWGAARWLPSFCFSKGALFELFGFSFFVFATHLFRYATQHVDKLLAGRYLGGDAVGLLDKAQSMLMFPISNISHVIGSVMFPALSLIQTDTARVRKVFLRSTQAIALLTYPMMVGMFVVAENFVLAVLGEHWSGMIDVFRILCVLGITSSIVTVTGSVFLARGKAKLLFNINLLTRPVALLGVVAGLPWGIEGIVIGKAVTNFINSMITFFIVGRIIDLRLWDLFSPLLRVLLAALMMGVTIYYTEPLISSYSDLSRLFIQIVEGVIFYAIYASLLRVHALVDVFQMLKEKRDSA